MPRNNKTGPAAVTEGNITTNHAAAVGSKSKQVLGNQIKATQADIASIAQGRRAAIIELSEQVAYLLDPDEFSAELFAEVSNKLSNKSLMPTPMFDGITADVEAFVVQEDERRQRRIAGRPSISEFLSIGGDLTDYAQLAPASDEQYPNIPFNQIDGGSDDGDD